MSTVNSTRIEMLSKENYDTWCLQAEALLVKNDTWGYVSGQMEMPPTPTGTEAEKAKMQSAIDAWKIGDRKAKADLILSISPSELKQIRGCETSQQVWKKLESIFASKGPARKASLLKQLILQKMVEGDDVREHIKRFGDIVDKLEAMNLVIPKDLLSIMLLYSLPETYENFRCAVETQDELPDCEKLKVKILEESEARKQTNKESVSGAMIAAKNASPKPGNCKGHNTKFENKKFPYKCSKCRKFGHRAADCRSKRQVHDNDKISFHAMSSKSEAVMKTEVVDLRNSWCLDSGCTAHLCWDKNTFGKWSPAGRGRLNLASNTSTAVEAKGTVQLQASIGANTRSVNLENALYVPDLRTNLLSVAKITDKDCEVVFKRNNAVVRDRNGDVRLVADRIGDLYYLRQSKESSYIAESSAEMQMWHERLGHLNFQDLKELVKKNVATGIKFVTIERQPHCDVCIKGKLSTLPFSERTTKSKRPLEIIHSDICGPMRTESNGRGKYFVTFIDDYSRWCEVYILKNKSDVFQAFRNYKSHVEKQTGHQIKALQSDNGKEYCSNIFTEYLRSHGIKRRLSAPYTPQQNGVSERKNRTLVEMARCMIIQSGLPPSFWAEAICCANYIRNRCPSRSLEGKTPFELWKRKLPNMKHFQIFGSKAFVLNKEINQDKFGSRSKEGVFVGYSDESKAYRIWIPNERKIAITRDVKFVDVIKRVQGDVDIISSQTKSGAMELIEANDYFEDKSIEIAHDNIETSENKEEESPKIKRGKGRPRIIRSGQKGRPKKSYNTAKETRIHSQSMNDVPINSEQEDTPEIIMSGELEDDVFEPTTPLATTDDEVDENLDTDVVAYAFNAELNWKEALNGQDSEEWKTAIANEVKGLIKNSTWELVNRPEDRNIVGCRFVLTNKRDADDKITRRKARLVAQGFTQVPGIDFDRTFAPVARLESIRLLLAIAAKYQLCVHQIDITTAYLNGNLNEEIFMKTPPILGDILDEIVNSEPKNSVISRKCKLMIDSLNKGNQVCRLKKALYGLKQAGRQWNLTFDSKLRQIGLKPINADPCVYVAWKNKEILLLTIYVDDVLIASRNLDWIKEIKLQLAKNFEVKDLGTAKYCLGIEIKQDSNGIIISQKGYIRDLLRKFHMEEAKTLSIPIQPGTRLIKEKGDIKEDTCPYRELVGGLMYAAVSTRPDIAHVVSILAQFNSCYTKVHWGAAKRVLRYLHGTINYGLHYAKGDQGITGFVDADWGRCTIDRTSYTGFAFTLSNAAISWKSQKQRSVALSSTEAEYMALSEAMKEAIHLKGFINELGLHDLEEIIIYNDNRGAKLLAESHVFHQRTKHIDIRYHFIRDVISKRSIKLDHMPTEEMPADVLTKALSGPKHYKCLSKLGFHNI